MRSHTIRHQAAFTLVELLVVIGIIALLISILLPALAGARRQAQAVVCKSNLQQINLATRMYANDNRDHYPSDAADDNLKGGWYYRRGPNAPGTENYGGFRRLSPLFSPKRTGCRPSTSGFVT
jgi:prepilin-type N-terminal cleavage/methylation domain-containing protein